jgi:endonuclease/exonuclease/phosphatase family metal-dependent hydrolase
MALPGVEPRGALIVDLMLPPGPLRIIAAHLGLLRRSRALQVEAILSAVGADHEVPTLFLGDLNEWRLGAKSSLRALEDSFHTPASHLPSFPAGFPILALDRIMGNLPGLVACTAVHDTPLSRTASDHLPVKAWVHLADTAGRLLPGNLAQAAVPAVSVDLGRT